MKMCVLGAGTMGRGIAQVTATAGHEVALRDVDVDVVDAGLDGIRATLQEGVDRGKLERTAADDAIERITGTTDLEAAAADAALVVEAVPEDESLKRDVLTSVETLLDPGAVVATNTSSLSVTALAAALDRPSRFLGLHFFNPVHLVGLVEVVTAEQTSAETVAFAESFVADLEKTAIRVRDSPGFASSRLGVALGVEAMRMVEEGVAPPGDIDAAMELGYNHPLGPLELTDVVGLDVRLDILEYLRAELGERFRPPQILKRKVRAGKLGRKTGEGFYRWEDGERLGPADSSMGATAAQAEAGDRE